MRQIMHPEFRLGRKRHAKHRADRPVIQTEIGLQYQALHRSPPVRAVVQTLAAWWPGSILAVY